MEHHFDIYNYISQHLQISHRIFCIKNNNIFVFLSCNLIVSKSISPTLNLPDTDMWNLTQNVTSASCDFGIGIGKHVYGQHLPSRILFLLYVLLVKRVKSDMKCLNINIRERKYLQLLLLSLSKW